MALPVDTAVISNQQVGAGQRPQRAAQVEFADMAQQPSADILQRLLVAKHLLAANSEQLTPNSDAAAVARMVLAAPDAAELAIAAIASHLNVAGLTDRMLLTDYAPKIEAQTGEPLSGSYYLRQLNRVRVGFQHDGVLPDAR